MNASVGDKEDEPHAKRPRFDLHTARNKEEDSLLSDRSDADNEACSVESHDAASDGHGKRNGDSNRRSKSITLKEQGDENSTNEDGGVQFDDVSEKEEVQGPDKLPSEPHYASMKASTFVTSIMDTNFLQGFPNQFATWEEFDTKLQDFSAQTYQLFRARTTTSVESRNKQMLRRKNPNSTRVRPIPGRWRYYAKTLVCTHGFPYKPRGYGKRHHNVVRDTGCSARINATLVSDNNGGYWIHAHGSGGHNHVRNEHIYQFYAENRRISDAQLLGQVEVMRQAGAKASRIRSFLHSSTGKQCTVRDVHNLLRRLQKDEREENALQQPELAKDTLFGSNETHHLQSYSPNQPRCVYADRMGVHERPERVYCQTYRRLFCSLAIDGDLKLKNRIVLAPMSRSRCGRDRVPTSLNEVYYEQRASAGLLITEATAVSEQGYGWYCGPAMYTPAHADGWKQVVERVHRRNGKIFLQLWHMGRQGHSSFNCKQEIVSASPIRLESEYTRDADGGKVVYETPRALETHEIPGVVESFRQAAMLAKDIEFDGVEIHAANGCLIDQFLQSTTNKRSDKYGGSFENRARLLLDVVSSVKQVYPTSRIGVRLSPNSLLGGMGSPDNFELFTYVMARLSDFNLAYLALVDDTTHENDIKSRPVTIYDAKVAFHGRLLAGGGLTSESAEGVLRTGAADLVSFGRLYMSNPDLVERLQHSWPLNPEPTYDAYWESESGATGYTDFPPYNSDLV